MGRYYENTGKYNRDYYRNHLAKQLSVVQCPHCNKEIQHRYIKKHIKIEHPLHTVQ